MWYNVAKIMVNNNTILHRKNIDKNQKMRILLNMVVKKLVFMETYKVMITSDTGVKIFPEEF